MTNSENNTAICGFCTSDNRTRAFADALKLPTLPTELHRFPDGENGLRVLGEVPEKIIVLAELDHPDEKFLLFLFLLDNLRDLGARRIELAVPYLPYMRQDIRFRTGEAVTSRTFAKTLSGYCDRLVTIDPHLHRYASLDEIYSIHSTVLSAAGMIASWVRTEVVQPVLVGPDRESEQWVAEVAKQAGAPYAIFEKTRHGDCEVEIHVRDSGEWQGHTPVLVDDIISSGHTMAQTVRGLKKLGLSRAICIGVHGLFAGGSHELLRQAGAGKIITTNSVPHASNAIDVMPLLASAFID